MTSCCCNLNLNSYSNSRPGVLTDVLNACHEKRAFTFQKIREPLSAISSTLMSTSLRLHYTYFIKLAAFVFL